MEWLTIELGVGGGIVGLLTLVLTAIKMVRGWAKEWETKVVATSRMLSKHAERLAVHEKQHENTEKDVDDIRQEIRKGFEGINKRLDNVVDSKRSAGG